MWPYYMLTITGFLVTLTAGVDLMLLALVNR
jgi:hypothetical protein